MSKAFDTVDINSILAAVADFGIGGTLFLWIKSYLVSRTQFVKVFNLSSDTYETNAGVPQGSHIGPMLFVMDMNKLPNYISKAKVLIYADDVKIFLPVRDQEDFQLLQRDLDSFGRFCADTGLTVNPSKCSVMSFTRSRRGPVIHDYAYNGCILPRVSTVRDLGVTLDSGLSFHEHIDGLIKDGLRIFALVRRFGRELDDPHAILAIYVGLVRSKLDFASVVWRPLYDNRIDRIEGVQKYFVRYALRNLPRFAERLPPYEDLCALVDMDTVYNRHRIADIVFFSNILMGRVISQPLHDRLIPNMSPVSLRRNRTFEPPLRLRNYTQHEPTIRFMREYDRLQEQMLAENSDSFTYTMSCNVIRSKLSLFLRRR